MKRPNVFKFEDYKEFLKQWIAVQPRGGRGELRRFAQALGVHPTLMSQVINGERHPSLEQALEISELLDLAQREQKYFLLLVQAAKAGSKKLERMHLAEADQLRHEEADIASKFTNSNSLDEVSKSQFYSDWTYSAVRLSTDLPQGEDAQAIASYLQLPEELVNKRLDFLLSKGLCEESGKRLRLGPAITHVPKDSSYVNQHHRNWRLKALERVGQIDREELLFTSPLTISKADAKEVSQLLLALIERVREITSESKAQELRILNLDWVKLN